ncbi:lamin tail-like protein [Frondihabitans sp. PhB188]|uniref:lamin tail domain-containing protein n=1 Tax=Frondihabitans sp. PhB188 TaxID=2485200 RepID=UPI000F49849F|nr:lamin tail domain-containing protein [Frondihabitans sp. PhB188]ROQ41530.1 lamin tail-like protein [Frondihabitans sp. PhB188]
MRPPLVKLGAITLTGSLAFAGILVATTTAQAAPDSGIVINEIESQGGTPGDWIEFANLSPTAVDMSGMVVRDDVDTDSYVIPDGTTIAPGAFFTVDQLGGTGVTTGFDFGLGGADSVRLYDADGTTLVDAHTWTAHATTTYGRTADGSFRTTSGATGTPPTSSPSPHRLRRPLRPPRPRPGAGPLRGWPSTRSSRTPTTPTGPR